MKNFICLLALTAFVSCQTKTTSELTNDSGSGVDTATQTSVDQTSEEESEGDGIDPASCIFTVDLATADALLETGTAARADSSLEAQVIWELDRVEPVSFNVKSKNIYPESADICDRDHWYNVKLLNRADESGWVNGVTLIFNPREKEEVPYTINGTAYKLYNGADTWITADNAEYGCEDLTIPYFYNPAKKTVSFIAADDNFVSIASDIFVRSHRGWLALASSDGGHASITDIKEAEPGKWKISLEVFFQDGGTKAAIYFNEDNGFFTAYKIEQPEEGTDQQ